MLIGPKGWAAGSLLVARKRVLFRLRPPRNAAPPAPTPTCLKVTPPQAVTINLDQALDRDNPSERLEYSADELASSRVRYLPFGWLSAPG